MVTQGEHVRKLIAHRTEDRGLLAFGEKVGTPFGEKVGGAKETTTEWVERILSRGDIDLSKPVIIFGIEDIYGLTVVDPAEHRFEYQDVDVVRTERRLVEVFS